MDEDKNLVSPRIQNRNRGRVEQGPNTSGPTLKGAAKFIAEMTPILGDAMAAKEVYEETQKEDPNWWLVGALGGATVVGLIPGVGDAASKLISKGAREAVERFKRVEVDPNALGSLGGNIRIRPETSGLEAWGEGSFFKIGDEQTPLYHGMSGTLRGDTRNFEGVNLSPSSTGDYGAGVYLTDSSKDASDYAMSLNRGFTDPSDAKMGGQVFPVYTNVAEVFTDEALLDDVVRSKVMSSLSEVPTESMTPHLTEVLESLEEGRNVSVSDLFKDSQGKNTGWGQNVLRPILEEEGFQGIQSFSPSKGINEVVIFNPDTIKSTMQGPAGTYSSASPDISFSNGGLVSSPEGYAEGGLVSKNAMSDYFLASAGKMTEVEFVGKHKMSTLEFERQFAEDNSVDISGTEKLAEVNTTPKGIKVDYSKNPKTMAAGGPVERDPVSGNEVPPGSTPENVRDDIPAMLSEGEYVIPADVLKFFGVNFFEKLRTKAKQGMLDMEQDGRVGGEPVDDTMETQGPLVTEELPMMAEGGLVNQPTFNPASWNTPGLADQLMRSSAYTYKEYFGPGGTSQMILFINGEPAQAIPAGFSETPLVVQNAVSNTGSSRERNTPGDARGTRGISAGSGEGPGAFGNPLGTLDFTDTESVSTWAEDKLKDRFANRGITAVGGLLGGAARAAVGMRDIAEVSAAARYYSQIGDQESSDRLMAMADEARGNFGLAGRLSKDISDGEGIFENYMESLNVNARRTTGQRTAPYTNSQGVGTFSRSNPVYDVKAGGDSGRPSQGDTVQFDMGSSSEDAGQRNDRIARNNRAADAAGVTANAPTTSARPRARPQGRNKGGLVSKRTNKK